MDLVKKIYAKLLKMYGPQGWWPITATKGYHPGAYQYPLRGIDRFEIAVGAILTQNTNWPNVERAIGNLKRDHLLNPKKLLAAQQVAIEQSIRPAGYYRQKAKKLRIFAQFFLKYDGKDFSRDELLSLWGVGPETADSILLYAYKRPFFVVDAYTRRIFVQLGLIEERMSYEDVRQFFESRLKRDVIVYQEYHALIVEHAKRYYSKKNIGKDCPLLSYLSHD